MIFLGQTARVCFTGLPLSCIQEAHLRCWKRTQSRQTGWTMFSQDMGKEVYLAKRGELSFSSFRVFLQAAK